MGHLFSLVWDWPLLIRAQSIGAAQGARARLVRRAGFGAGRATSGWRTGCHLQRELLSDLNFPTTVLKMGEN